MKKTTLAISIFLSIILVVVYTLANTYSVIINITDSSGTTEIINDITIHDLMTNEDGTYNNTYYNVINELNLTREEADILMSSTYLNKSLKKVLNSIVDYKYHNIIEVKLSNDELYNLIVDSVNKDNTINEELKNKVITKSSRYKQDISDFLYNISVSLQGET